MRTYLAFVALLATLILCQSCDDRSMTPPWEINGPRILAITVNEPIFSPGDDLNFSLLVAGLEMSERTGASVEWTLGNILKKQPLDRTALFTAPASDDIDTFFGADPAGEYIATGSATVTIRALLRLPDGQTFSARKNILLAKPSVVQSLNYQQPQIDRIVVGIPGHSGLSLEPGEPVQLPADLTAEQIDLSATFLPNDSIERYRYRWYLEAPLIDEKVMLYGDPQDAEIAIMVPQRAFITVYLVIEDASEETKASLFHAGADAATFTVSVGTIPDADIPSEQDAASPDDDLLLTTD